MSAKLDTVKKPYGGNDMKPNQILTSLSLAIALALAGGGFALADSAQPATDHDQHSHAPDHHPEQSDDHDQHHHGDDHHAHGHAGHELLPPVPENHEPWAIDEPLGKGMTRVRQALADVPSDADAAIEPAAATALADEVDSAINFMFANCQLPPEPDAALHGVLAQLMVSSRELRDDAAGNPLADMRGAVDRYALLFDDADARAEGYGTKAGAPH
ncbi:MAG: hypothetical protein M0Q42_00795 [Xanthomonadales bacterium]|nr:hypothetical protein [Xanthomonadales bacterium]